MRFLAVTVVIAAMTVSVALAAPADGTQDHHDQGPSSEHSSGLLRRLADVDNLHERDHHRRDQLAPRLKRRERPNIIPPPDDHESEPQLAVPPQNVRDRPPTPFPPASPSPEAQASHGHENAAGPGPAPTSNNQERPPQGAAPPPGAPEAESGGHSSAPRTATRPRVAFNPNAEVIR
ncbi:hypothetical protein EIP91_007146 [Steccherinum ochraceum]|uniref:Uncharacterized protein n=1 Tax=Steccherinum ochraceum TaxID=92696 RepID=A0A4R0RQP9_9APHY|nr:hypothetical protein EIP91_007146 [Steccherinum ochraceum]